MGVAATLPEFSEWTLTIHLFHMAILLTCTKSFFRPLVFVATVRIRNTSLCGVWSSNKGGY